MVAGGGRGIGAATAILAAQQGYRVLINYRNDQHSADTLVKAIRRECGEAWALQADISRENEVISLFEQIDERRGVLDALVNNAGVLEKQCDIEDIDGARLQRVFATNVFGAIYCSREAVKRMSPSNGGRGGSIVNLSSIAATLGSAHEYIDYAASRGRLIALPWAWPEKWLIREFGSMRFARDWLKPVFMPVVESRGVWNGCVIPYPCIVLAIVRRSPGRYSGCCLMMHPVAPAVFSTLAVVVRRI